MGALSEGLFDDSEIFFKRQRRHSSFDYVGLAVVDI